MLEKIARIIHAHIKMTGDLEWNDLADGERASCRKAAKAIWNAIYSPESEEKAAFEAYFQQASIFNSIEKTDGIYCDSKTRRAYAIWQARAALERATPSDREKKLVEALRDTRNVLRPARHALTKNRSIHQALIDKIDAILDNEILSAYSDSEQQQGRGEKDA